MNNADIRKASRIADVKLWQIAERLGIADTSFSRKLRKEFSPEEKERIFGIIQELEEERGDEL